MRQPLNAVQYAFYWLRFAAVLPIRVVPAFLEVDTWDLVYLQIRTKLAAVLHSGLLCKNIRMSHSICVNSYLLQMVSMGFIAAGDGLVPISKIYGTAPISMFYLER